MKTILSAEDQRWLESTYEKLKTKLSAECDRIGSSIPYTPEKDGKYADIEATRYGLDWWTNGFWPGMLWQMYHATGEEKYRRAAEGVEEKFDKALQNYMGLHHDVGFMWLHTAVADYRLTGNERSRVRGLHAANLLAGRYNPAGKFIRAWNMDRTGWIIVDCMMNIPLLYWASDEVKDPRFRFIAESHADTCRSITVRGDGSCNHISILNPENGECVDNPAGQGFASGSSWSRGQAWAVYGFALSHLHTGKEEYLETAKTVAHYFISNLAVNGWLPLCDFRSPQEPVIYDTTAGVCAACGMLEIAKAVSEYERPLYVNAALNVLKAIDEKFCNWDPEADSIVSHGTSAYHSEDGRHIPIIYGDYFFTEAILRLLGKDFLIW